MKIGIDARSITSKICGVSRVTLNLIIGLSQIDRINEYIIYTDTIDKIEGLAPNFKIVMTKCNRMNPLNDYKFYRILKSENLDILHSMHSWLTIFIPKGVLSIVTIHDIFSVSDPNFFHKRGILKNLFRLYFIIITFISVKRAKIIITVSKYCAKELVNYFSIDPLKIKVVYNSAGIVPHNNIKLNQIKDKKIILYLGNFRSYKNVPLLLKGYAEYVKRSKDESILVIAGNDKSNEIEYLCDKLELKDRVEFYYRPSDLVIDNLYNSASLFIFPSLYEGFGIPPLEAMSYGVPVIISDADALVETSGQGALVFDRYSSRDLADKIYELWSTPDLESQLIVNGYNCVKNFTWKKSADKLIKIYTALV